jgi:hypothetical protein
MKLWLASLIHIVAFIVAVSIPAEGSDLSFGIALALFGLLVAHIWVVMHKISEKKPLSSPCGAKGFVMKNRTKQIIKNWAEGIKDLLILCGIFFGGMGFLGILPIYTLVSVMNAKFTKEEWISLGWFYLPYATIIIITVVAVVVFRWVRDNSLPYKLNALRLCEGRVFKNNYYWEVEFTMEGKYEYLSLDGLILVGHVDNVPVLVWHDLFVKRNGEFDKARLNRELSVAIGKKADFQSRRSVQKSGRKVLILEQPRSAY